MRLLSVGSLPPEWGGPSRGGVATFHASLLTGLLQHRSEVEIVGVLPPTPLDREPPVPVFVRPEEVSRANFYEDLLERLRPDVVIMNHVANTIGVTHARLQSPVPAIGILHSWHSITFSSGDAQAKARKLTEEALTGLAAVVFGSHHTRREGEALGLRYPEPARTIHLPLAPFYAEGGFDVDAAERRGVAFLGSLIERKNPLALVGAAAATPGLEVSFAGDGELEQPLLSLARSHSLGDRVRIVHLADPAVRDLLLRSQAMCLPSRSETFGLAYIEALSCGTPVVGFGPTVREIGDEMGIEIGEPLDTGSPEEIAAAIERVVAATWDRRRLRSAAVDAFGLSRITDRYLELLRQVAGRPALGRA